VTAVGASFLVGRTLTKGYRTLLAPGFLADVGVLSRFVVPGRDGLQTTTVDGRPLTLVSHTQQLGPSDVDEHGRPVVLVYGFVSTTPLDEVAPADLDQARAEALAAYRRARARDDTTHESSVPFALSSIPTPVVPSQPEPRRRFGLVAVVVAALALAAGGWAVLRPSTSDPWTGTWQSADVTVTLDCSSQCTKAGATQPTGCRYALSYRSESGATLTFQATPSGNECLAAGKVTLSRTSGATAELRWYAGNDVVLDTSLSKTA